MFDFNDAAPQMGPMGELIPDGTFAKVKMTIRPGGTDGAVAADKGLLKPSSKSDAKMLDCEFVVMEGPFARRKFWQEFCVAGGKTDSKTGISMGWNISKSTFRAMIESAIGLDPKDMSEEAKKKRTLSGLSQLNGITFVARIMVEPADSPQHKDQNRLANVVVPGDEQYAPVMRGEQVSPDPINAKPRKAAATQQAAPSWQSSGHEQQSTSMAAATPQVNGSSAAPAWLS